MRCTRSQWAALAFILEQFGGTVRRQALQPSGRCAQASIAGPSVNVIPQNQHLFSEALLRHGKTMYRQSQDEKLLWPGLLKGGIGSAISILNSTWETKFR